MSEDLVLSFDLDGALSSSKNGGKKDFTRLKVPKDGSLVLRILPPYGVNHGGVPFKEEAQHWGFLDENGDQKPVDCTYSSEGSCPVCKKYFDLKDVADKAKASGATKEDVSLLMDEAFKFKSNRHYLLNVVDATDNTVKILEIPKTALDSLLKEITKNVKERKFDPLSLTTGCWFKFYKTGKMFNTEYFVETKKIIKETADGEAEFTDKTPIDSELLEKIQEQLANPTVTSGVLFDIHKLGKVKYTSGQLKAILDGAPVPKKSTDLVPVTVEATTNVALKKDVLTTTETKTTTPTTTPTVSATNATSELERLRARSKASAGK